MNQRLADQLAFGSFFLISPHVHVSLKFLVHMSLASELGNRPVSAKLTKRYE